MHTQKAQTSPGPIKILGLNQLARLVSLDKNVLLTIAETAPDYYNSFDRFKKIDQNGIERWRHIDNPTLALKEVQDRITRKILKPLSFGLPKYLVGGMPGRSVLTNAYPHIGKQAIVEMDLEKCFETISHNVIYRVWRSLGYGRDVSNILTKLTTLQNRLPQGSPASTILCNLALADMAQEINLIAEANDCTFTLYVDDIALSGDEKNVVPIMSSVIAQVTKNHLKVNGKKTEIIHANKSQAVTGVLTNRRQTVSEKKYQEIRKGIIELSKEENAINVRRLKSIWSKIHHVVYIDPTKGKLLVTLANSKLKDIKTFEGPKLKTVRTRNCKSIRNKH